MDVEGGKATRQAFARQVPDPDCDFLLDLPFTHEVGDYFFVHAGVRPGFALDDQLPNDLLMIREPFLESAGG